MSITAFTGPLVSFGQAPYGDYNPEAAPSLFYAGTALLDPRLPYSYEPGQNFGNFTGGFMSSDTQTLNVVPYTASATAIAAAANTAAATPMTLVAASSATTGVAVGVSVANANTGVLATGLLEIDGYTSVSGYICNGTSGVAGNLLFVTTSTNVAPLVIGQTLAPTGGTACTILGYGPSTGTTGSGKGFLGVYTVSGAAQAVGTSGAPVTITATQGAAGINAVTSASAIPFGSAGTVTIWNPQSLTARVVKVTPTTASVANTFTIAGYDIYGFPMTEVISTAIGSTAVSGLKAWKYIASITPSATDGTGTYSVGTTDTYGLPLRSDNFADIFISYSASLNPTPITSASGYTPAVTTPSTTTTGDVRGTYTLQTAASSGANRLVVTQSPQVYNIGSVIGLFGVPQT